MSFPKLEGEPVVGKYYDICPEGALTSNGKQWHGIFKKGKENKTVVYFFGGGVSITEETSKRGKEFYAVDMTAQDFVANGGIGSDAEENPFKDWNFIIVPYTTGDFHTGTNEFRYDEKGKEKVIYHQGYKNYSLLMNSVLKYVEDSDTLLVTGFSAGGFATSLLADDVINYFPKATNINVCVDSSLLLYDGWKDTATNLWKSPVEISERLVGNNIVLDSLTALHEKRGNKVKILFDCSYRDDTLQEYQAYINNGKMEKSKENGDLFQKDLKGFNWSVYTRKIRNRRNKMAQTKRPGAYIKEGPSNVPATIADSITILSPPTMQTRFAARISCARRSICCASRWTTSSCAARAWSGRLAPWSR